MKKSLMMAVAVIAAAGITPAHAQIDWLGNHLESQRQNNMIRHQQEMVKGKSSKSKRKSRSTRKTTQRKVVMRYPQVQVNGKALQSPVKAVQRDGYTFVPMREIFEALGATVTYEKEKRLITADRNGSGIQITMAGGDSSQMKGSRASVGGGERPYVQNGVAMVPLRFVSEKMGANVKYTARPTTPLIEITSKN